MLDLMYKLPDQRQGGKYVINEDVVEGRPSSSSSSRNAAKNRRDGLNIDMNKAAGRSPAAFFVHARASKIVRSVLGYRR